MILSDTQNNIKFRIKNFKDAYLPMILFVSEDLQAEIDEIDNDIASMQKELRVSDTSDTSISEERIISPAPLLSDSPEF